jgi:hypothetical protein
MDSPTKLSHDIMLELLSLRNGSDMDLFIDKLYIAVSEEFMGVLDTQSMTNEHRLALSFMVDHFLEKEEYEKCAVLREMIYSSSNKENK